MAYVPPALRKKAQASSPDGPLGTTAQAAGSHENLPPGIAPPRSAAEPIFSLADIHKHYWDAQNDGEGPSISSWSTINASAQEPDKLSYVVLFREANPRWESHGVIFVKSKLHILPGGERFRDEQLNEAEAIPAREPVKSEWDQNGSIHKSENLTGEAGSLTSEVPNEKMLVREGQISDESQVSVKEHLEKQRGSNEDNKIPDVDPEPPYSPDLSLYPPNPIAVFEQAPGGGFRGASARFRFAGYHRIASLEYLPPHSRELFRLLEQKWTTMDRRGRLRQEARSAESWKRSLKHRWAVIQMEKDQEANATLPAPEIEVRNGAGGGGEASSGKSVNELLAEMRLKG